LRTPGVGSPAGKIGGCELRDQNRNRAGCAAFAQWIDHVSNKSIEVTESGATQRISRAVIAGASPTTCEQATARIQLLDEAIRQDRRRARQHDCVVGRLTIAARAVTDGELDIANAGSRELRLSLQQRAAD
jgi:hypothetical protein